MAQISNHKHVYTNSGSPFFIFESHCQCYVHALNYYSNHTTSARVPTPVFQGREIEQPCQRRWKAENMNHHCRRRSSRDKYCEDNPPCGNQEKQSNTDLVKQDLEDRT
jgi:hypothetical protein